MMAGLHGLPADASQLRHEYGTERPFDATAILLAAKHIGMSAKRVRQDPERLDKAPLPVVASIPCYIVLSLLCTPMIRTRLNENFNRGAENQTFLVETISGIDTIKCSGSAQRTPTRMVRRLLCA